MSNDHVDSGNRGLRREIELEELKLGTEVQKEESGFLVGGVNSTDQIRQLESLSGVPISVLERNMKPEPALYLMESSFLGANESLLVVLADDNDYVLSRGLTHQEIALPLRYAGELHRQGYVADQGEFDFKGARYSISVDVWRGVKDSPFKDGLATNTDLTITNVKTGESLRASGMHGELIHRYGFYEGPESGNRVGPDDIIRVFGHLQSPQEESEAGETEVIERSGDDFNLRVEASGDTAVFSCHGIYSHLENLAHLEVKSVGLDLIERDITKFIMDLTKTTEIDSTFLGTMVGFAKRLRPVRGSVLVVKSQTPAVNGDFERTGLDTVFPMYDREVDAKAALAEESGTVD